MPTEWNMSLLETAGAVMSRFHDKLLAAGYDVGPEEEVRLFLERDKNGTIYQCWLEALAEEGLTVFARGAT